MRFRLPSRRPALTAGCFTTITTATPSANTFWAWTPSCTSRGAGTTLCPPRASRASWCIALSRPGWTHCPAQRLCIQAGRSLLRAWRRCWPIRAPWPCSTRPTTPSCTSPWSMRARWSFCAGWVSRLSALPIWSANLRPCSTRSRWPATAWRSGPLTRFWPRAGARLAAACARVLAAWADSPNLTMYSGSAKPCAARGWYEPTAERCSPIREGDFLLIDIWARLNTPGSVYYDITWTGVVGREPAEHEQKVFEVVVKARDAAIRVVEQAFTAGRPICGFEADDAARAVIQAAGFGEFFTHRTGHNIGQEVHGVGANLDNLETHDVRLLLPNTCFSVEPGIYLPEFGVRSEIDMLTAPGKAWVTGQIQRELVRI